MLFYVLHDNKLDIFLVWDSCPDRKRHLKFSRWAFNRHFSQFSDILQTRAFNNYSKKKLADYPILKYLYL